MAIKIATRERKASGIKICLQANHDMKRLIRASSVEWRDCDVLDRISPNSKKPNLAKTQEKATDKIRDRHF